mmetsp:Transcript_5332/g.15280  ORF Transcript_5332/g.15280 Transcript_5332/m.15280 type:complete len:181 (+) Transcript_5332:1983-2525(+)
MCFIRTPLFPATPPSSMTTKLAILMRLLTGAVLSTVYFLPALKFTIVQLPTADDHLLPLPWIAHPPSMLRSFRRMARITRDRSTPTSIVTISITTTEHICPPSHTADPPLGPPVMNMIGDRISPLAHTFPYVMDILATGMLHRPNATTGTIIGTHPLDMMPHFANTTVPPTPHLAPTGIT